MTYENEQPTQPILLAANPGTILRVYRQANDELPVTVTTQELSVVAWIWEWNDDLDEHELAPIVLGAGRGFRWQYPETGPEVLDVAIAYRPESLSETPDLHPSWRMVEEDGEESEAATG